MLILFSYCIIVGFFLFLHFYNKGRFLRNIEIHNYSHLKVILMLVYIYTNVVIIVGVPGLTYSLGLSGMWTALITASSGYVPFLFLGNKLAIVAKKYKSHNFLELIESRYNSSFLGLLCGLLNLMLVLLLMITQLVGMRYIIDIATGSSIYFYIYAVIVTIYFTVVGVRNTNYFNFLISVTIFIGSCILVMMLIQLGGGLNNIKNVIYAQDPQYFAPLGPEAYKISYFYIFSYWLYLGFGVLGMPTISYRSVLYNEWSKTALFAGTVIIFVLTFNMSFIGLLSKSLLEEVFNSDEALPLIIKYLTNPVVSFIFFIIILLAFLGNIKLQLGTVNVIFVSLFQKIYTANKSYLTNAFSKFCILIFLGVSLYFAANYKLNLFSIMLIAVGGFASTFTWTIIFIPFKYKFVNKGAAIVSIIFGLVLYSLIFNLESNWRSYIYPASLPVVLGLFVYVIFGYLYYFFTKILFKIIS